MSNFIKIYNNIINTDDIKRIKYEGDFYDRVFIIYYKDKTYIDLSNSRFKADSYKRGVAIDTAYEKLKEILLEENIENE